MRNIRLTLQYDGTNYFGWQRQKNTRQTISEILEDVLKKLLQEKVKLVAAGRTDAGVHAQAQTANFLTVSALSVPRIHQALNALLPEDIRVVKTQSAALDFNSRYSAKSKTYRYLILNRRCADVFRRRYVYHYPAPKLDVNAMRRAGYLLLGSHDFLSFKRTDKTKRSTVRELQKIRIARKGSFIRLEVTANSFLYHMVRNIAGTLIEIGKGKLSPENLKKILQAKDRKLAGPTAPARGLCLMKVKY